ncbi:DUF1697 domain-containing protein [Tumidithrix elongata RA019]|uniref:DUF1697 domain-containing protein n=1 Tax=Tumidithrix elongata BACA0141 TaxID=2716417 RepID=A0AAW9Q2T0_9CYAN|nr:DUF1697 domain-containing protein [Tumidithrix elongata RA019]
MPRYIAFLRAINVGGHTVKMDYLRSLFEAMDFSEVSTFIASGNVIFNADSKNAKSLEKTIEQQLKSSLGYDVATFIRTDQEVSDLANYKPFTENALQSALALNIAFLAETLTKDALQVLNTLKTEIDDFHTRDREVYWLCKKKQSESTFSNAVFEKKLKLKATFRSASTISKIAAKYPAQ